MKTELIKLIIALKYIQVTPYHFPVYQYKEPEFTNRSFENY